MVISEHTGNRIPGLDGIRGLSILLIILFHCRVVTLPWVSIQLFFVLSGFLITGILLRESTGNFGPYIKRFYMRRTLRIFPIYYILTLALFAYVLLFQEPLLAHIADWPYVITYTYNIKLAFVGGQSALMAHLWSLAVEEQFYLLWPLIIYFTPAKYYKALFVFLIVSGPLFRYLTLLGLPMLSSNHDIYHATYKLPTSHLDAFACGALLCVVKIRMNLRSLICLFALFVGFGAWYQIQILGKPLDSSMGYPLHFSNPGQPIWGYTVWNILSAALIAAVVNGKVFIRFFELSALRYIGKVSYGMYLVHFVMVLPMFVWVQSLGLPYPLLMNTAAVTLASIAIASVLYYAIEKPVLALKDKHYAYKSNQKT